MKPNTRATDAIKHELNPYFNGLRFIDAEPQSGFCQNLLFMFLILIGISISSMAQADTGDILDDTLAVNTGVWICGNNAVVTWADIDEDGEYDTQVVFTTQVGAGGDVGEAQITHDDPDGKWYFFSFENGHCGGAVPGVGRGRFTIHFVDILAPGFIWDDATSWTYKTVPALSLRTSYDGCFAYSDPRYDGDYLPYQRVHAYAERNQVGPISPFDEVNIGGWRHYQFTHVDGIKELYINTDFCENILDDLQLYNSQISSHIEGGRAGLVLLVDTSGSMDWSHQGIIGVPDSEKRLTLAKDAAIPIVELMNDHTEGDVDFAIARFPLQPLVSGTCNAQIITAMTGVDDGSAAIAVDTTLPSLTADGTTPMLTGISTALASFGEQDRRAVVLLSDGYHNCPNRADVADAEVTAVIADALSAEAKIFSIGFGRPGDVDHLLLDALATGTGGEFYDVTSAGFDADTWTPQTALQEAYVAILAGALSMDLGADPRGIIDASKQISREIAVSKQDKTISFYLSWASRQPERLDLQVYSSDGDLVPEDALGVSVHQGETYKIVSVKSGFLQQSGKVSDNPWRIDIQASNFVKDVYEYYQYSVLISSELKMRAGVSEAQLYAGKPITVSATLTENGQALTGLNEVEVMVTWPKDSVANWLVANHVSAEELAQIPAELGSESLSNVSRKFRYLRDVRKLVLPSRTSSTTLKLYDDGSHGDATADDGIYTNQLSDTEKSGTYSFLVRAQGETASGQFERELRLDKYVGVMVAKDGLNATFRKLTSYKQGIDLVQVSVIPQDSLGNYLGPNHSGKIKFRPEWGQLGGAVIDNLDGSYSQILEIPSGLQEPLDINISVGGVQEVKIWVSPLAEPVWSLSWLLLLLLVIIVVTVWVIRRPNRHS